MAVTGETGARISDAAVEKRTGKNWAQWFKLLDAAGAKKFDHKSIAKMVHEKFDAGDWWSQMITVAYEQARGLRKTHERPDGFSISVTRTIGASAAVTFRAWNDARQRAKWLLDDAEKIHIRKRTPSKSLRITWSDDVTSVEVNLYPKPAAKTQVSVQHNKLKSARAGAAMKRYWAAAVARLRGLLEA